MSPSPPRVLILTASVGAGHDLPAATLAAQLEAERPGVEVVTEDALAAIGGIVKVMSDDAAGVVFFRFQVIWDIGFWFVAGCGPTRRLTQTLLTRQSTPGLLKLIERTRPDVVVSTYPNVTEVLGRLRRSGRLEIPVIAAITDLAALDYWASRGVDVHLVTHPESIPEVRRIAGGAGEIHCVHGFSLPEFRVPMPAGRARELLGLPASGRGRTHLWRRLGRRRRDRCDRGGTAGGRRDAGRLSVRVQRVADGSASSGRSGAMRGCASRGSPIVCPTGWPR